MTSRRGLVVLAVLVAAAAALLAVELGLGAAHFGKTTLADPCTTKPSFAGGGLDGAVQRFALSGLNGAACSLHTSREELVLSFAPSTETKAHWSKATIDRALRAGLDRAAKDTAGGGITGRVLSFLLREIVANPVEWFLERR